jgi:hypothetical protein
MPIRDAWLPQAGVAGMVVVHGRDKYLTLLACGGVALWFAIAGPCCLERRPGGGEVASVSQGCITPRDLASSSMFTSTSIRSFFGRMDRPGRHGHTARVTHGDIGRPFGTFRPGGCQAHPGGTGRGGSGGQSRRGRFLVAAPPVADLGVAHPARPSNPLPPALPQPGYRDITSSNDTTFPIIGRARCASTQSRARRDARSRTRAAGRHVPHRRCSRYRGFRVCAASPSCRPDRRELR